MAQDYYSVLGVPKDATSEEIKRAYRQIARKCHPDKAGGDQALIEQFKGAQEAYKTLMDPEARAKYDRRHERRQSRLRGGTSFFDAFYKATGDNPQRTTKARGAHTAGGGGNAGRSATSDPRNKVSLEDLFNDFGNFGFNGGSPASERPKNTWSADPTPAAEGHAPQPGADVSIPIQVPAEIAQRGGSVTVHYFRLQRADSWTSASADAGVVRIQEIADVRVLPGTRDGEVLREKGMGDAGAWGGSYGDLLCAVKLVGQTEPAPAPAPAPSPPPAAASPEPRPRVEPGPPSEARELEQVLPISLREALEGGKVEFTAPTGKVLRITIKPGSNSGTRLRLRGKGGTHPDGTGRDLVVTLAIQLPSVPADGRRAQLLTLLHSLDEEIQR